MQADQPTAALTLSRVQIAILDYVGERKLGHPATSNDLLKVISPMLPAGSDASYILSVMLIDLLGAGEIEQRGNRYVKG